MKINTLEQFIPDLMQKHPVDAVSIVIIEDSEIAYRNGFGEINGETMQADTVFTAQSLTKPIVAFKALQMVENGQLNLDTPLRDYLDASYLPDDSRVDKITARHCLSHATGFPNWRDEHEGLSLQFEPGTDFNYSGEGYCYLQKVMQEISGQPLEELIQPLLNDFGMTDSYLKVFDEEMRKFWLIACFPHLNTNAAFSLMSSADDFAKFMLVMLDEQYKSITDVMLSPEQGVAAKSNFHWGNGWGLEDTSQGRYFWQWGSGMDARHLAIGNVDKQWAAVVMTHGNGDSNNGLEIAHEITRQFDSELGTWMEWLRS